MGWKPTWWDFGKQYKVAAPKGSPRLWILVLFIFILFIYVCLCLIVSVDKNWLLEIELFRTHSKDMLDLFVANTWDKTPSKWEKWIQLPLVVL